MEWDDEGERNSLPVSLVPASKPMQSAAIPDRISPQKPLSTPTYRPKLLRRIPAYHRKTASAYSAPTSNYTARALFHSPRPDLPATSRSLIYPTERPLSDRFLRLQKDLRRAGYDLEAETTISPTSRSYIFDEGNSSGSPRQKAIPIDQHECLLHPSLRWCAYCKAETVAIRDWVAGKKTW
jgi:hypothetical protein